MPDFTQNFNRYSYALNNPLRYTDENGEFAITACLIAAGVCMLIDYGIQVGMNYWAAKNNPSMTAKDIWLTNIDWFDVGISGILGGVTAGFGASYKAGESVCKFGMFFVNNAKWVNVGEMVLTSCIDVTGDGYQKVSGKQIGQRVVTGLFTMALTDAVSQKIGEVLSENSKHLKKTSSDVSADLPQQEHHFATNKNQDYTPKIKEITDRYGLDLDGDWNKAMMPHMGRHPNDYHKFVYETMEEIDKIANGDQEIFLSLFDQKIKQIVMSNPQMSRKAGWPKK